MNGLILTLILILSFLVEGCGKKTSPKPDRSNLEASSEDCPDAGSEDTKKSDTTATEKAGGDNTEADTALKLAGEGTYYGAIVPFLKRCCLGCHAAGKTSPSLATFEENKTNANQSLVVMKANHKNLNDINTDGIPIFEDWAAGGYLLGEDPGDGGTGGDGGDGGTGGTGDTTTGDTTTIKFADVLEIMDMYCNSCHSTKAAQGGVILDTQDDYDKKADSSYNVSKAGHKGVNLDDTQLSLLKDYAEGLKKDADGTSGATAKSDESECKKPGDSSNAAGLSKMKECHDQGLLFDRRYADKCHTAKYGTILDCSWDYMKKRLSGAKGFSSEEIDKEYVDEGWKLDQCGSTDDNKNVFMMIKTGKTEKDITVKILTR